MCEQIRFCRWMSLWNRPYRSEVVGPAYGCDGLTLVGLVPLHKSRHSTRAPPPAAPPISIHLVFNPCAACSGAAATQTADSSRVACCPSWTMLLSDAPPCEDAFFTEPVRCILTSFL